MAFIGRRGDNSIYGVWSVKQADGQEELSEDNPEVVAFFAPKPPVDLSNLDGIDRKLKAIALCIAQVGGLTTAQMKVLYKQKWDALLP